MKKIANIHVKRDIKKQNHAQSQRNSHNKEGGSFDTFA